MELVVAALGILVGLGGLAVAVGALFLQRQTLRMAESERAAGARQVLYEAQTQAIAAISASVADLYADFAGALRLAQKSGPGPLDEDGRKQVHEATTQSFVRVLDLLFQQWAILPRQVLDALNDLLDAVSGVVAQANKRARWPPEYVSHPDPLDLIGSRRVVLVRAMREALGTEPLTQQTLDRIGRPRPE